MNLNKKKKLASRTFSVGKDRIIFTKSRIEEIKQAITKQDMRDLLKAGAINIRDKKGIKKVEKRKRKRNAGKIKKKIKKRKRNYVIMVRKLRSYVSELKKQGKITKEQYYDLRKKVKNKYFESKAYLKEYIKSIKE